MSTLRFLGEWALRSSILILVGGTLLRILRIKDAAIRLMTWNAILCASLMIPLMTAALPGLPIRVPLTAWRTTVQPVALPAARSSAPVGSKTFRPIANGSTAILQPTANPSKPLGVSAPAAPSAAWHLNWPDVLAIAYGLVALAFLVRLGIGLLLSRRLFIDSLPTDRTTEGIEIRESERLATPVTLGILRPVIVLPTDWDQWDEERLSAVLAHERSHIRRRDPAMQLISATHRALQWFNPLSWFLHSNIVRIAEEASDDAVVAATQDRAAYAEVLLEFMQRGARVRKPEWVAVPMARHGRMEGRIHRILDATVLGRGATRRNIAIIVLLGSPLAWIIATAQPQSKPVSTFAPLVKNQFSPRATASSSSPAVPEIKPGSQILTLADPHAPLTALGVVTAVTATVKPLTGGLLTSVNFKEGESVQEGQLLARIDERGYQTALASAQSQLDRDLKELNLKSEPEKGAPAGRGDGEKRMAVERVNQDRKRIESLKNEITASKITAPISGVAGLRMVEAGNLVHPNDAIVVIAQLHPISVIANVPQDALSGLRAQLTAGKKPVVELWNRSNTVKLATGTFIATDNQIDQKTGMIKIKASFENKDDVLIPNQFVNVHVMPAANAAPASK